MLTILLLWLIRKLSHFPVTASGNARQELATAQAHLLSKPLVSSIMDILAAACKIVDHKRCAHMFMLFLN